ncbi:MAG: helix-turn-helix domain-containing protein [Geminicoccaceae bacterium]
MFAANIKSSRERAKRTQKDVASILDVNLTTYKHYEKSVDMPSRYIKKFAIFCGVPIAELFEGDTLPDTENERRAIRVRAANKNH